LKSINEYTIRTRSPNWNAEESNAMSILKNQLKKRNELVRQLKKKHDFVTRKLPSALFVTSGPTALGLYVIHARKATEEKFRWMHDHAEELQKIMDKELGSRKPWEDMTSKEHTRRYEQEREIKEREYNKYKESLKKQ